MSLIGIQALATRMQVTLSGFICFLKFSFSYFPSGPWESFYIVVTSNCAENAYVSHGECVECAPGSSNDGGDNPNEGDTSCEVTYCQENEIELETVPKLISKPLKERLRHEAQRLNYMKASSKGVLPL